MTVNPVTSISTPKATVNRDSITKQKHQVSIGLNKSLTLNDIWQPVEFDWYLRWKEYVAFDTVGTDNRSDEEILAYHPGPIDNKPLLGSFGDELKRPLLENQDFVLLPDSTFKLLVQEYGGGPACGRKVRPKGSNFTSPAFVDLYPIRFEIFSCDQSKPLPADKADQVLYFPSSLSMAGLNDEMKRICSISDHTIRCWLRMDVVKEEKGEDGEESHSSGSGFKGRFLTSDRTDLMGSEWRLLRNTIGLTAYEISQDGCRRREGCVHLLVEKNRIGSRMESDWPRYSVLQIWKKSLRALDVVDVQDTASVRSWKEAVVLEVGSNGDITVHFKGWSAEHDAVIPHDAVNKRIEPLYSRSKDWRGALGEDDKVEVKVSRVGNTDLWISATVTLLDSAKELVQVAYLESSVQDLLKKEKEIVKDAISGDTDSEDKDKKSRDNEKDDKSVDSASSMVVLNGIELPVSKWVGLHSEDICAAFTHTYKPKSQHTSTSSSSSSTALYERDRWGEKHSVGKPIVNGAVGIGNLGNTCFLNSILQCMSNTQPLTEIFTGNSYKAQINTDNALGHGGRLAQVYGSLMKDMWSDGYTKVIPRDLKRTIGEFQPQFAGYDQQDSQELMGFLLDGLHEDLNRAKKKPFVTKIESKGREDLLIARESWRRHLLRNDSELVDKAFGLLRSHVTCTNCKTESVTFDPYNSLSLPIPLKSTKTLTVIVQLLPIGSVPIKLRIEVSLAERVSTVIANIGVKLKDLGYLDASTLAGNAQTEKGKLTILPTDDVEGEGDKEGISMSPTTSEEYEVVQHPTQDTGTEGGMGVGSGSNSRDGGFVDLKRKATATARLDSVTKEQGTEGDNHKEQKDKSKGKGKGQKGDRMRGREGEREGDKEGEYDMVVVSHVLDGNTCDEDERDDENMGVEGSTNDNDNDQDNDNDADADADDFLDKYEKSFQTDKMNVVGEITTQNMSTKHGVSSVPVPTQDLSNSKLKGLPIARSKVDHKGNNNSTYLAALALTSKLPTKHNTTHANICPDLPGVLTTPSTFAMYGQKGMEKTESRYTTPTPVPVPITPPLPPHFDFHVCTIQAGTRDRPCKLEKTFLPTADAYELVNAYNQVTVQQLGLECPVKPAYTSSSATSFFTYIDLCLVAQSDDVTGGGGFTGYSGSTGGGYGYSSYSGSGSGASKNANPALFSHPVRVVVTKYVTNKEVHDLAWKCAKRFVIPSARSKYEHVHDGEMHKGIHAPDLAEEEKERERNVDRDGDAETGRPRGQIMDVDEKPYDIVICPSYGYKGHALEYNDERLSIMQSEIVTLRWKIQDKILVDLDYVEACRVENPEETEEEKEERENKHVENEAGENEEVQKEKGKEKEKEKGKEKEKKKGKYSIQDCIDKFVEREQLAPEETLYCSSCKQHLAPVKKMDIWAAPDILILHLKRFQYVPGQYFVHREKINEIVDFPILGLDLSQYVLGPQDPKAPPLYDLYAVSQHSGGMGGGHYTAVCKNAIDKKWYNFNDSWVSETSPEMAVNEQAYVLFYQRRSGSLRWAGIVPMEGLGLPDDDAK